MDAQIIGLHDWLASPAGRYLLAWEDAQCERAVADIFGYHALQLGWPRLDALRVNRMPHRWLAIDEMADSNAAANAPRAALMTNFSALPFPAASLDLVVLPHTLETHADPHATLREVARVLVPEGRVVICGLNPASLWGLRRWRERGLRRLGLGSAAAQAQTGSAQEAIAYWRVRDWLKLLDFEIEIGHFGCYRPAVHSEQWLQRWAWMDSAGPRWWSYFGAAYFLVAVKRVHGVRLIGAPWKAQLSRATMPAPLANRSTDAPSVKRTELSKGRTT